MIQIQPDLNGKEGKYSFGSVSNLGNIHFKVTENRVVFALAPTFCENSLKWSTSLNGILMKGEAIQETDQNSGFVWVQNLATVQKQWTAAISILTNLEKEP